MIAQYDLGGYRVELPDVTVDEQMADIWLDIGKRAPWKRLVASYCAKFCNVFALMQAKLGILHFFGKYGDLCHAKYLTETAISRLEVEAEAHIDARRRGGFSHGQAKTLRAAFLNTAAYSFGLKLGALKEAEKRAALDHADTLDGRATALTLSDYDNAEAFAADLYEDRQMTWGKGRSHRYKHSSAGAAAGNALSISRGVASNGPKLIA